MLGTLLRCGTTFMMEYIEAITGVAVGSVFENNITLSF